MQIVSGLCIRSTVITYSQVFQKQKMFFELHLQFMTLIQSIRIFHIDFINP